MRMLKDVAAIRLTQKTWKTQMRVVNEDATNEMPRRPS